MGKLNYEATDVNEIIENTVKHIANGEIHVTPGSVSENNLSEALTAKVNAQADWNQTTSTALDFIKNKPSWIKGEVDAYDLDAILEEGIYVASQPIFTTQETRWLLFVSSYYILGELVRCRQVWTGSEFQIRERVYKNGAWSEWESYAYQSDLTPILSDIVNLKAKNPTQGTKTATSTGVVGQTAYDNNYFYRCIATNSWVRFAITPWGE